jgi:predicted TIM-barrel fold metal-dependent hydrolase
VRSGTLDKLKDVGAGRIAAMDAGMLSLMVLSQQSASGIDNVDGCRKANDAVAAAVATFPKQYAGFANIPMALPEEAAAELERSVKQLDFKGALIWNYLKNGTYYDGAEFCPVFAMAQKLDVSIYLHPASPTADIASKLFAGNYPAALAGRLGGNSWGWHVDYRPYRLDRTEERYDVWPGVEYEYLDYDECIFTVRAFQQLRQVTPIERIVYSVDCPFSSMSDGWKFVERLAESEVLKNTEMDMFAYKNAKRLLKLWGCNNEM